MNVNRESRGERKIEWRCRWHSRKIWADSIRWEDWKIEIESELGGQFRAFVTERKCWAVMKMKIRCRATCAANPVESLSLSHRDRLKSDFYDLLQSVRSVRAASWAAAWMPDCLPDSQPSCLFIRQMHLINESQCCATQMRSNVIKLKQQQQQQQQLNQVERKSWSRNRSRNKKASLKFHFCLVIFRIC